MKRGPQFNSSSVEPFNKKFKSNSRDSDEELYNIRSYIDACIYATKRAELEFSINKLSKLMDKCTPECLLATDRNGYSHCLYMITLAFERIKDFDWAGEVSFSLFNLFVTKYQEKKLMERFAVEILSVNHDGSKTLLHHILKLNSHALIDTFFSVLQDHPKVMQGLLEQKFKDGGTLVELALQSKKSQYNIQALLKELIKWPAALTLNLRMIKNNRVTLLRAALINGIGNEPNAYAVLELLEKDEVALRLNLKSITNDGFSILHSVLKRGCETTVKHLLTLLEKYPPELALNLKTVSSEGFSVLDSALQQGSETNVKHLVTLLERDPEALAINLKTITNNGYGVLQTALNKKSEANVKYLITLLEKHPEALAINLISVTKDGYCVLYTALKKYSEAIGAHILRLLEKHPNALAINLNTITRDKCTVLHAALMQDSESNIKQLSTLLEKNPDALAFNLKMIMKDGYNILQTAINKSSEMNVKVLLTLSEKHPEILARNLKMLTTNRFSVLHSAFKNGSVIVVKHLLTLSEKYPEELFFNLNTITSDGFTILHTAIVQGSQENVKHLMALLEKNPAALAFNLCKITSDGFSVLQSVLKKGSPLNVKIILNALKKFPDALDSNLNTVTKDGYSILHTAIKQRSEANVTRVLEFLENHPKTLVQNLETISRNKFSVLRCAVKQGIAANVKLLLTYLDRYPRALAMNLGIIGDSHFIIHEAIIHSEEIIDFVLSTLNKHGKLQHQLSTLFKFQSVFDVALKHASINGFLVLLRYFEYCPTLLKHQLKNSMTSKMIVNLCLKLDASEIISEKILKEIKENNDILNLFLTCLHNQAHQVMESIGHNAVLCHNIQLLVKDTAFAKNRIFAQLTTAVKKAYAAQSSAEREEGEIVDESDFENLPLCQVMLEEGEIVEDSEFEKEALFREGGQCSSQSNHSAVPYHSFRTVPSINFAFKSQAAVSYVNPDRVDSVIPFAGINKKYIDENPLAAENETITLDSISVNNGMKRHTLTIIERLQSNEICVIPEKVDIAKDFYHFSFYSHRPVPQKNEQVTFVCAGRKAQAHIPQPKVGRCIIVCTENEFKDHWEYSVNYSTTDILIIHAIKHPFANQYYEQLGTITARRLGIFLAASAWKLRHFLMIDDNVHHVDFKSTNDSWDSFYALLQSQLGNNPCVTVTRHYSGEPQQGQLGSKLFMIDLQKIHQYALRLTMSDSSISNKRAKISFFGVTNLFLLFASPRYAHLWGEDYFLQIMFYAMFKGTTQGYAVVDKSVAILTRTLKSSNAFRNGSGKANLARPWVADEIEQWDVDDKVKNFVELSAAIFNDIVDSNLQRYQQQKEALLFSPISDNIIEQMNVQLKGRDFAEHYKQKLLESNNALLRPYQTKAIKALAESSKTLPNITMATGSGKSIVQAEFAWYAFQDLQPGEYIVLVTGRTALVTQLRADLLNYYGKKSSNMTQRDIIPVSSASGHVDLKTLPPYLFKQDTNPKILVFCEHSIRNMLDAYPQFLSRIKLLLLDEYHEYINDMGKLPKLIQGLDIVTLGCTATPPQNDPSQCIFEYSLAEGIEEGYLAEIQFGSLGKKYQAEEITSFITDLPDYLARQQHPQYRGKTNLLSCKGIIYLPTVEHCNKASAILTQHNIENYAIHSKNASKEGMAQFKQSKRAVLLACQMLRYGFDDAQLGYVVIAQNPSDPGVILQMIGRVARKDDDKIGYVIGYDNVLIAAQAYLPKAKGSVMISRTLKRTDKAGKAQLPLPAYRLHVKKTNNNLYSDLPSINKKTESYQGNLRENSAKSYNAL